MAKRAFLTNIGKKPLKALYAKDYSGFYQPKCPLSRKYRKNALKRPPDKECKAIREALQTD